MNYLGCFFSHEQEQENESQINALRIVRQNNEKFANEREKANKELVEKLKKEGHVCIIEYETFPSQIGWCKQEKCVKIKN